MYTIVFVAPFPMPATLRFCRALAGLQGVRLVGLFQQPPTTPVGFAHVEKIPDALDPACIRRGVERVAARFGRIHRLIGVLENLQEQVALVRAELGLPGTDPKTARLFRDKAAMKEALRAAGLPCARHALLRSAEDAKAFVAQVGLPIVIKPPDGAGCRATYRIQTAEALAQCLQETRPSPGRPALAEEFLTGEEHSYETLTVGGQVRFSSITRYLPTPLEATENPWVQWVVLAPRDISGPAFDAVHETGPKVCAALGLDTSITHMEWFRRPNGGIAIGEIAARPPGARIMDLMGWVHQRDLYHDWARLIVHDEVVGPYERRFAAAAVFLRQPGQGRVIDVAGLDEAQREIGHLVVDRQLPRAGQPKSSGYEGEGWVILRHPETEGVLEAVRRLFAHVRVRYA